MGMQEDDEDFEYWEIPTNIDVNTFDFTWRPSIYEPPYIHQFGTQWGRTGGPRYVGLDATQIKYQDCQRATALPSYDNWDIPPNLDTSKFDFSWHPDDSSPPFIYQFGTQWARTGGPQYRVPGTTEIKYIETQIARALPDLTLWDIPPNLDTSKFDFSWHPEATEKPFIYQFGTQHQKTGGPRYTQPRARRIKYVDIQRARRLPDKSKWVVNPELEVVDFDWSWHPDDTDILCNYAFGTHDISSKEMPIVYQQAHGAPMKYMDIVADAYWRPLDIIFVSNGETGEEDRYHRLCRLSGRHVEWVRGIGGRENALREAARISSTSWFILFPGKLWADEQFDFNFQPTRSHDPKHYIFYARNPLNGLEYGHQAAVCYHRQLVLDTINYGLDFTMSKPHDIVPVNSGVAQYNSDRLMTWRTAFREVIKLRAAGDPESIERLERWLNYARGEFSEWSLIGAEDGVNYYNQVDGDHEKLMLTFEWQWLKELFNEKYQNIKN
jgi:hypothetical protein